jgi:hypothetical protein
MHEQPTPNRCDCRTANDRNIDININIDADVDPVTDD